MNTIQTLVMIFGPVAFCLALYLCIHEVIGLYKDIKKQKK